MGFYYECLKLLYSGQDGVDCCGVLWFGVGWDGLGWTGRGRECELP